MAELMKGHKWRDYKHKMVYPAWVEIKTDEIRCHVTVCPQTFSVTYISYAGKPLHNMQVFDKDFVELASACGVYEYDLGFEVNENYNDSYRWVRSSKGLPEDLVGKPAKFLLFDLPHVLDTPYRERYPILHNIAVTAAHIGFNNFVQPRGWWAIEPSDVDNLFQYVRDGGHEGLMVKDMGHMYERGKRSYGWLKVKPEDDADGVIRDIHCAIAEDGTPHAWAGSVTIECEDGSIAQPHGIKHELGEDMVSNPDKYIGQWAEFKYMERDRQGGYRHPVFHRLREAKA